MFAYLSIDVFVAGILVRKSVTILRILNSGIRFPCPHLLQIGNLTQWVAEARAIMKPPTTEVEEVITVFEWEQSQTPDLKNP